MPASRSLPDNLARFRKARDLSQEQLAAAAGVAVDTVARIERAERKTTRPSTVSKLATALGVTPEVLLGIVPQARDTDTANVAALRHAITASEEIPGLADFNEQAELLPLATLTESAHSAWRAYVDGRHGELLHALPTLLVDARRLAHDAEDDLQAAAHRALSTAYRLGAGMAGRAGFDDLAWTSAERALDGRSPVRLSRPGDGDLASATSHGRWSGRAAGRGRDGRGQSGGTGEPACSTATRSVRVCSATCCSTRHRLLVGRAAGRADDLLTVAQAAAMRSRGDSLGGGHLWTACGRAPAVDTRPVPETLRQRCGWPRRAADARGSPGVLGGGAPLRLAAALPRCGTTSVRFDTSPRLATSRRTGCATSRLAPQPCARLSTGPPAVEVRASLLWRPITASSDDFSLDV